MPKTIVLDANILIRAVLGRQIDPLLHSYASKVSFVTVEEAFDDARTYIPPVIEKHKSGEEVVKAALEKLAALESIIQTVPLELLDALEMTARERLRGRDEEDWPFLALALLLNCPIWTEDTDFFGCGVPIWTSDRIELFLKAEDEGDAPSH